MTQSLINKLDRKLTDVFKRTRRRDALLADLYRALCIRDNGQMVHERAVNIAYLYWNSPEVGQCLAETLEYYSQFEGPVRALELGKAIIRTVPSGAVFEHILGCFGRLQKDNDTESSARTAKNLILNRVRCQASGPHGRVIRTEFCFEEDRAQPFRSFDATHLSPSDYMRKLKL